jgi:hypothetical protein
MKCWYRIRKRKTMRGREEFSLVLSRSEAEKLVELLEYHRMDLMSGIFSDMKRVLQRRLRGY